MSLAERSHAASRGLSRPAPGWQERTTYGTGGSGEEVVGSGEVVVRGRAENQKVARSRISVVSSENACATDTFRVTTTMLGGYGQLPPRGPDVLDAPPWVAGPVAHRFKRDPSIPYDL